MKYLTVLALRSAWNRRYTLGLTLVVITFSLFMMLAIERLRIEVKNNFAQSVSGTDLIIGARSNPIQLILYSIFHLGEASTTMSWESAQMLKNHPAVSWAIPITLGDSHHHFPVVGTTTNYFTDLHYGNRQSLAFAQGKRFSDIFEVVLGAEVANQLHYHIGDQIVLEHGEGEAELHTAEHADKPFTVVGILENTGTPIDRSLYISLEAIEAIHLDWQSGMQIPGVSIPAQYVKKFNLTPKNVVAVLVGLKSRTGVLAMQREINTYTKEPLTAILPAVTLAQLWQLLGSGERALLLVSIIAVSVGFIGLVAVILASLNERRRELAILRSVGATPLHVFFLLIFESFFIVLIGAVLAYLLLLVTSWVAASYLMSHVGVLITPSLLSADEYKLLAMAVSMGALLGLLPAYRAYRLSLADGLIPRV